MKCVRGGLNHKNQHQRIKLWHQDQGHPLSGSIERISGWCCMLKTTGHCSRCWNTLYMYKEDLIWVWGEWGASNIRTNRDPTPIPTTTTSTIHSQVPEGRYKGVVVSLWPLETVVGAETLLFIYKEDLICVWREWWTSIISTNRDPPPIPTTDNIQNPLPL
jgi:hypothetical protein